MGVEQETILLLLTARNEAAAVIDKFVGTLDGIVGKFGGVGAAAEGAGGASDAMSRQMDVMINTMIRSTDRMVASLDGMAIKLDETILKTKTLAAETAGVGNAAEVAAAKQKELGPGLNLPGATAAEREAAALAASKDTRPVLGPPEPKPPPATPGMGTMSDKGLLEGATVAGAAGFAAFDLGKHALESANTFQQAMVEIAKDAGLPLEAVTHLGETFLTTFAGTSTTAESAARAYGNVAGELQTMYGETLNEASAIEIMKAASNLSVASTTDLNSATTDLVSTMKTFNLPVSEAAHVSNDLYNAARLTGQQLPSVESAFQRLGPVLAGTNAQLDTVAALFVELNKSTGGGRAAIGMLSKAITDFKGETPGMKKGLDELGITLKETGSKSDFITQAIDVLHNKFTDFKGVPSASADEIHKLQVNLDGAKEGLRTAQDSLANFGNKNSTAGASAQALADKVTLAKDKLQGLQEKADTSGGATGHLGVQIDQARSALDKLTLAQQKGSTSTVDQANNLAKAKTAVDKQTIAVQAAEAALKKANTAMDENAILQQMFGPNWQSMKAVIDGGTQKLSEYENKLRDSTTAEGAAQQQEKTYEGQMAILHNTMHTVSIEIGQALIPIVTRFLQVLIPFITQISNWITQHKDLIATIITVVTLIGGFTAATLLADFAVRKIGGAFDIWGNVIVKTGGFLKDFTRALMGLNTEKTISNIEGIAGSMGGVSKKAEQLALDLGEAGAAGKVAKVGEEAVGAGGKLGGLVSKIPILGGLMGGAGVEAGGLGAALGGIGVAGVAATGGIALVGLAALGLATDAGGVRTSLKNALFGPDITGDAIRGIGEIRTTGSAAFKEWQDGITATGQTVNSFMSDAVAKMPIQMSGSIDDMTNIMQHGGSEWQTVLDQLVKNGDWTDLQKAIDSFKAHNGDAALSFQALAATGNSVFQKLAATASGSAGDMSDTWVAAVGKNGHTWNDVYDTMKNSSALLASATGSDADRVAFDWQKAGEGVANDAVQSASTGKSTWGDAVTTIESHLDDLRAHGQNVSAQMQADLVTAMNNVTAGIQGNSDKWEQAQNSFRSEAQASAAALDKDHTWSQSQTDAYVNHFVDTHMQMFNKVNPKILEQHNQWQNVADILGISTQSLDHMGDQGVQDLLKNKLAAMDVHDKGYQPIVNALDNIVGQSDSWNNSLITSQQYVQGLADNMGKIGGITLPAPVTGPPGPGRASGGPFSAGESFMVGEKGPEVVQFGQGGTVFPNGGSVGRMVGGSGGGGGNVYIDMSNSLVDNQAMDKLIARIGYRVSTHTLPRAGFVTKF